MSPWPPLALLLALSAASCGTRNLESCAAYVMVLGPVTFTLTCPPPGWQPPPD